VKYGPLHILMFLISATHVWHGVIAIYRRKITVGGARSGKPGHLYEGRSAVTMGAYFVLSGLAFFAIAYFDLWQGGVHSVQPMRIRPDLQSPDK
jgi:hypothetical protein